MPLEERRFKDDFGESSFGDEGKQAEICKDIMAKTGELIHPVSSEIFTQNLGRPNIGVFTILKKG